MTRPILSDYLGEIARIHATRAGTGEISYYGALAGALNSAGERLKPRVFCVPNLRNRGAGFPDMGLFVAARDLAAEEWPADRLPERGVVEVDDIPANLSVKAQSEQVRRYLGTYGVVLVTNYRDFVLLGRDAQGRLEWRETFSFGCNDADAFFALARSACHPAALAARFAEFLERVLLHQAPLARPEGVAFFLASYARDALARIEEQASLPAFAELRAALQEALGLTFEGPKGEHLFRSTLVQTLFYGLFSAWAEVAREGGTFDWHAAGWGHAGKGGAVMPGHGRTAARAYTSAEAAAATEAALLGAQTFDVFLNADAYWRNVPENIWSFMIGGYQVLKKWLSYRERDLLGRALTPGEVRYVRDVARRLAALRLMAPALDANYRACAAAHRPLAVTPQ